MTDTIDVNKTLLVVFALSELGGQADVEHIAVKAHELFPQQFSWKSFPQYPDKDAVRVHLSEAKKATAGVLVMDRDLRHERRGDSGYTKRYALTAEGLKKVATIRPALTKTSTIASGKNSLDYKRLIEPVTESDAYRQFLAGSTFDGIGRDRFLLAAKLFADSTGFVIAGRLARVISAIDQLPDSVEKKTLTQFFLEGRRAFKL